jgi:hypothetical protein
MKQDTIAHLYTLLGKAVLNPVPAKMKECFRKGWQLTTWEESQSPEYQKALVKHGNTGVLLGRLSDDLISVDCDSDPFLEDFLAVNPSLKETLISKGRRGGNVWLRMIGDYPSTFQLVKDGQACGEFRSHGSQTIIAGVHPSGSHYSFLNEARPLSVHYPDIKWPEGVTTDGEQKREGGGDPANSSTPLHSSLTSPPSLTSPFTPLHDTLLYDTPSPEAIEVLERFQENHRHLHRLYDRLIAHLLPLVEGSRNLTLTKEVIPRLFGALSGRAAGTVLTLLIEADRLGGYPSEEARQKFGAEWSALEVSWREKLSEQERKVLDALRDNLCRETFKICRELALNESNGEHTPPQFFLSSECLAVRLGLYLSNGKPDSTTAWRTLRKLRRDYRILVSIDPGSAHGNKERGRAAVFAWAFPFAVQK